MVTSLAVVSVFLPSSPFWNNFEGVEKEDGYTSVIVLLTGITAARFGKQKFNENTLHSDYVPSHGVMKSRRRIL